MENDKNLENIDLDSKDSKDETKSIEELKKSKIDSMRVSLLINRIRNFYCGMWV